MKWARLSWLTAGRHRRSQRHGEPDFGDMGTAFGLDASAPDAGPWHPSNAESGDREPAVAAEVTWNDRIVRRSGL